MKYLRVKTGRVPEYLTEGKLYEVLEDIVMSAIRDDAGDILYVNHLSSAMLDGGDFEVLQIESLQHPEPPALAKPNQPNQDWSFIMQTNSEAPLPEAGRIDLADFIEHELRQAIYWIKQERDERLVLKCGY